MSSDGSGADGHDCGHRHADSTGCPATHHHERSGGGRARSLTRRAVLAGGAGLAASLAGCLGSGDGEAPDPVTLTQSDQCEICGMIIPNHPGPTSEIFYADQDPSGHENPARFDSTWEAFQYDFERTARGWKRTAFYVTDYSSVDYELTTDAGDTLISTHVEAGDFVDATEVTFVVGSRVKGAMGRDLIAFSEAADAESFQAEYGGDLMTFDEVTEGTIAQLANQ